MAFPILLALSLLASDFSRQLAEVMEAVKQGDIVSADQAAQQLEHEFPNRPRTHHVIGIIRMRQGRVREAEASLRKSLELEPGMVDASLELSRLYRGQGRAGDGLRVLESALAAAPEDPGLLYEMGVAAAERNDFAEAVRYLKRVPETKAPEGYWETVGRVLASAGDFPGAEFAYNKLLEQRPGSIPALRVLAGLALKQGGMRRGWDYIAAARREAPNSPRVLYEFGQISLANYLLSEAISAARLLLLLDPDNPDYRFLLGRSLLSGNQLEAAQAAFERYLEQRPQDANGQMMLGMTLYRGGDFESARPRFEEAAKLDPKLIEADFYLGMVAYSQADDETAERLLKSVLDRDPKHGEARLGLGKLYLRQRDYSAAISELSLAAALLEEEPDVHFQLSRAYGQLGQTDRARSEVAKYRELKALQEKRKEEAAQLPFTLPDGKP